MDMQYGNLGFILFKLLGFLLVVGLMLLLVKIKGNVVNFKRALIIGINVFNVFMLYVVINNKKEYLTLISNFGYDRKYDINKM